MKILNGMLKYSFMMETSVRQKAVEEAQIIKPSYKITGTDGRQAYRQMDRKTNVGDERLCL
jgi:hypothetical protein